MPEINKLIELRSKLVFSLDWLITGKEEVLDSHGVTPKVKERRQIARRQAVRRLSTRCLIARRSSDSNNAL